MKKTTLITGGAGFIGSHLCDLFISYADIAKPN
ncbi:MAG: NAD-dependent epimerase/dehydratase family protein [Candidatus Omnitrophota bacterium]